MIRFSALLVAVAIALLVSGVIASSLPLVYVSIGGCAVAALLLAVGVYRHRQQIFGASGAVVQVSGSVAAGPAAGSVVGGRMTGQAAGLAPGPARESVGPDTAQRPVRERAP